MEMGGRGGERVRSLTRTCARQGIPPLNGMSAVQVLEDTHYSSGKEAYDLLNYLKGVETPQFYTTGTEGLILI